MWKHNKFKLGDRVALNGTSNLEFQVFNVLKSETEKKENYLYSCILEDGHADELGKEYKYHESDLSFIRSGTKKELKDMLDVAVEDEDYELAGFLKNQIDKF